MKRKKIISLSSQINLMFSIITIITSVLFIFIFRQSIVSFTEKQSYEDFETFHEMLIRTEQGKEIYNTYYTYAAYRLNNENKIEEIVSKVEVEEYVSLSVLNEYVTVNLEYILRNQGIQLEHEGIYYRASIAFDDKKVLIVSASDDSYSIALRKPLDDMIVVSFVALIILGNVIILIWTGITVERISILVNSVSTLHENAYSIPVKVDGNDEITILAETIDEMRLEILKNDEIKQEMLQNLSHDIKTPIAVIKTYSEAIKDGIAEAEDIDIIIKQTDVLTSKVKKLLEWNRIEYLSEDEEYYPVDVRRILTNIANNYKFKDNIKFELNLDNSYLDGLEEHYYTMFSNVVENALRYAKSIIKITLNNKKVTIYNDGEPIDEKFLNNEFKPYEKGHKGQFGLGLTIVQKTCNKFNLKFYVENIDNGVKFTIEPL